MLVKFYKRCLYAYTMQITGNNGCRVPEGFDLQAWCSFEQSQEIPVNSFAGGEPSKEKIIAPYLTLMNSAYWQKIAEDGCNEKYSDAEVRFSIGEAARHLAMGFDDEENAPLLSWTSIKNLFGIKEARADGIIITVFAILALVSSSCIIKKPSGPWDEDGDGYKDDNDCDDKDPGIYPGATDTPCNGVDENCDSRDSLPDGGGCADVSDGGIYPPDGGIDGPNLIDGGTGPDVARDAQGQDSGYPDLGARDVSSSDTGADARAPLSDARADGGTIDSDAGSDAGSDPPDAGGLPEDTDGDGVPDEDDNCPGRRNHEQFDFDMDGIGDVCDDDADGDRYDTLIAGGGDCDDWNASINPGAAETACDGVDNDCDTSATPDIADADGDGFLCDEDCDDGDNAINPLAAEIEGDGIDNNCDGYEFAWAAESDASAPGYDTIISLAPDAANGTWVGGYAFVTGEDYNAWAGAVDADGNLASRWMNSGAEAFGRDWALGVALNPAEDSLLITGQHTAATRDGVLWITRAETPIPAPAITHRIDGAAASEDMANDVLALGDGSSVIISSVTTRLAGGGARNVDIDLRRIDRDGLSVLWNLSFAGDGDGQEKGLGLALAPGTDIFYAAARMFIGGQARLMLAAINIDGEVVWQRTYPGIEPRDSQNAKRIVAALPDGILRVVAEENGATTGTDAYQYTVNTANGDILSRLPLMATAGNDWSNGIVVDVEGRSIIGGAFSVPGQGANASLMIVDGDGNVLWHRMHNGPASLNDIYCAVSIGESGRVFVGGNADSDPPNAGVSVIMALDPR